MRHALAHQTGVPVVAEPLPAEAAFDWDRFAAAVGDVRSGSIKRVASAVGEGAAAVRLVHEHLPGSRTPPAS